MGTLEQTIRRIQSGSSPATKTQQISESTGPTMVELDQAAAPIEIGSEVALGEKTGVVVEHRKFQANSFAPVHIAHKVEWEDGTISEHFKKDLQELSKKTLGSYVKKAADEKAYLQQKHGTAFGNKKIQNKTTGIRRAVDKLTKEDLDEAFMEEFSDLTEATCDSACASMKHEVELLLKDAKELQKELPEPGSYSDNYYQYVDAIRSRLDNISRYKTVASNCYYKEQQKKNKVVR